MIGVAARAAILAAELHRGQRRDGTREMFIEHPLRVAARIEEAARGAVALEQLPAELFEAALLHDAIEDGPVSANARIYRERGARVHRLVAALTDNEHLPRETRHERQAQNVLDADPIVALVKLADKTDNVNSMRYGQLPATRALRYCDGAELVGHACSRRLAFATDVPLLWQVGVRLRAELEREIALTRDWATP